MSLSNSILYVYEYGFSHDGILNAGSSSGNRFEFKDDICCDKANSLNTKSAFQGYILYINASGAYSCPSRAEGQRKRKRCLFVHECPYMLVRVWVCGCVSGQSKSHFFSVMLTNPQTYDTTCYHKYKVWHSIFHTSEKYRL